MAAMMSRCGRLGLSLPVLTAHQRDALRVLPTEMLAGLRILRDDPAPSGVDPASWMLAATDAILLAADGWARQALDLGWTEHDLFGVDPLDSHDFAGLAVWLNGRHLSVLDADRAVAVNTTGRFFFNRCGFGHGKDIVRPPVLLWEFGRMHP